MSEKKPGKGKDDQKTPFDGVKAVAEMLNFLDEEHRAKLLKAVAEKKPELAEKIREKLKTLDSLLSMDDLSFQKILKEVGVPKLALALKTASEAFKEKVLKNLSSRTKETLAEEIQNLGQRRKSEIEQIHRKIMEIVDHLIKKGDVNPPNRR